jgi:hypothetical protein
VALNDQWLRTVLELGVLPYCASAAAASPVAALASSVETAAELPSAALNTAIADAVAWALQDGAQIIDAEVVVELLEGLAVLERPAVLRDTPGLLSGLQEVLLAHAATVESRDLTRVRMLASVTCVQACMREPKQTHPFVLLRHAAMPSGFAGGCSAVELHAEAGCSHAVA